MWTEKCRLNLVSNRLTVTAEDRLPFPTIPRVIRRWQSGQWDSFLSNYVAFPLSELFHQFRVLVFVLRYLLSEGRLREVSVVSNKTIRCQISGRPGQKEIFHLIFLSCKGSMWPSLLPIFCPANDVFFYFTPSGKGWVLCHSSSIALRRISVDKSGVTYANNMLAL
jgi:hypothetical protein